jgi:hypothetical protein
MSSIFSRSFHPLGRSPVQRLVPIPFLLLTGSVLLTGSQEADRTRIAVFAGATATMLIRRRSSRATRRARHTGSRFGPTASSLRRVSIRSYRNGAANNLTIEGANLTPVKARLLLMASLMKFGSPPPARDPRHPTEGEKKAVREMIAQYQRVFSTH